ncbi:hypothetical protein LCGC14_0704480 [marine sediment metagenome]|uniref:Uncharacterized protein n=1 Tax=marine sediment metagenome TaxID=412755 RepID=A0A0F9T2T2_9ZZZZ
MRTKNLTAREKKAKKMTKSSQSKYARKKREQADSHYSTNSPFKSLK